MMSRWLITGDSISKGIVFDPDRNRYVMLRDNYVRLVFDHLNGSIVNVARFGNTIGRGVQRLTRDVCKHRPDTVLFEYGGNDCDFDWDAVARDPHGDHQPRTELNRFRDQLASSVAALQQQSILPVLMTLPPLEPDRYFKWITRDDPGKAERILIWLKSVARIYWWQERYHSVITQTAWKTGALLVDIRAAFLNQTDYQSYMCVDGIHPNARGHRLMADAFVESLELNRDGASVLPSCSCRLA
jgi:lysophospholipase L1-like esterase